MARSARPSGVQRTTLGTIYTPYYDTLTIAFMRPRCAGTGTAPAFLAMKTNVETLGHRTICQLEHCSRLPECGRRGSGSRSSGATVTAVDIGFAGHALLSRVVLR